MKIFSCCILLCLSIAGMAQITERAFYGAKFEPRNGILVGAGQDDVSCYNEFSAATGKMPFFFMSYIKLNSQADTFAATLDYIKNKIDSLPPAVSIQMGISFSGRYTDRDVGAGKYDSNLVYLADCITKSGRRWYLRPGYEFNLWTLKYSPGYFRKAFRHIASFFEDNVNTAMMWSTAGGNGNTTWASTRLYYPGDDVVDWWGWNFFKGQYEGVRDYGIIKEFCDTAGAHGKPVMIAEMAPQGPTQQVTLGIKSWKNFFAPLFGVIESIPQIKAISYINWNWPDHAQLDPDFTSWGDTRLQTNQLVKDSFNSKMADPTYLFITDTLACEDDSCLCNECIIYIFTGDGNWDDGNNWRNNNMPPDALPPGSIIVINPITGGECILNKAQKITGGQLRVRAGKKFRVLGDLIIE